MRREPANIKHFNNKTDKHKLKSRPGPLSGLSLSLLRGTRDRRVAQVSFMIRSTGSRLRSLSSQSQSDVFVLQCCRMMRSQRSIRTSPVPVHRESCRASPMTGEKADPSTHSPAGPRGQHNTTTCCSTPGYFCSFIRAVTATLISPC